MRHALYCVLCAILSLLLIASGFRYVSDFWLLSFFFSFQTHIGLALMVGAVLAFLVKRGAHPVVLFLLAIAITGHSEVMRREFLADPARPLPADAAAIRLLSLNVLSSNQPNAPAIASLIAASGADVVYLLEAEPLEPHLADLAKTYPFRVGCGLATETCDLVILSRHPFKTATYHNLSDLRRHRFAVIDIDIAGRTLHFAAAHLSKPYFDDYHTGELERIAEIMGAIGGDYVLAGDFNSASIAPDMQRFLRSQKLRTGDKEPATWPVIAGRFGIPIDHVYATPGIVIRSLDPVDNNGSNHFGLMADMVLLEQPRP